MKPFARMFDAMFPRTALDPEAETRQAINWEWDRQRARAVSASDLAEIDAIFSRAL